MKILKIILLVIAILIVIPLVVALFVAKEYAVERYVEINKPKSEVFDYVKYLKNQDNFSKWASNTVKRLSRARFSLFPIDSSSSAI